MLNIDTALQECRFFEGISEESRKVLAGICRVQDSRKRDILFHEGDPGSAIYILLEGDVQLHKLSAEGKEIVIKVIKPGEMFGEVILFERNTYPVTATAVTASRLLTIPKREMLRLLEQIEFRDDFIAALMRKMRYLSDRIQFLSSFDVEERLRLFLREHFGAASRIECKLSKKDMAAAIGTTPESLSRLLLRLKERKLLSWHEDTIDLAPEFWSDDQEK